MRDYKVCVNISYGLEFKGTLEHLFQLSCTAGQNEARDVNDVSKVTGFLVVELGLPSGFLYNSTGCTGVDNRHVHTQCAELLMATDILTGSLVSWNNNLNVHTFLETRPK